MTRIKALRDFFKKFFNYESEAMTISSLIADVTENAEGGGGSSDWDDIENRPAITSGDGENSVLIGQIEQSDLYEEYPVLLTGDANTKIYSFTTSSPSIPSVTTVLKYQDKYYYIAKINIINSTIELSETISSAEALSNAEATAISYVKIASGQNAVSEGNLTQAFGNNSHAEGGNTRAVGNNSHAEGSTARAIGGAAHAEGTTTRAVGSSAHAEGVATQANGTSAHAEGSNTQANGTNAHAEGNGTIAASANQHVQGKYNIEDANDTYAFIVGNGTKANDRSNALAMKWDGTFVLANGTEITPAQITALLALLN